MIWYYFNIIISSLFSSLSSLYLISSSWYSFVWCNYHQSNVFKCVHLEYANGVWSFLLSYPQSHSSLSPFPLSLFTSHFLFYFHLSLFTRPFSLIIPHFSFFIPHFMFFIFFYFRTVNPYWCTYTCNPNSYLLESNEQLFLCCTSVWWTVSCNLNW